VRSGTTGDTRPRYAAPRADSGDVATDRTLPAAAYTDVEHYRRECDRIFRREWLLVASAEQLREPGDYVALELVGEPIVVVRGADGAVRALSSVCRHRYMLVAEPGHRGRADCFTCPYHRWRYDLDGRLTSAPFMSDVDGFDRRSHCLPSFAVEEWQGLVFVSLDANPAPLAPRLEPIRQTFERYGMVGARQVAFYDKLWNCNWKIAVENASECYHHLGTHKELFESSLPARGTYGGTGGPGYAVHHVQVTDVTRLGVTSNPVDSGLLDADLAETVIYTVFPCTLVLNVGFLIGWFSFLPEGVDRCRFLNGFLAPAALAETGVVSEKEVEQFMNDINDQDEQIIRLVQRGVGSAHAQPGMLSHKEPALADFYAYLRQVLQDETGGSFLSNPQT
jgi:phenylpropionate dioxygenase-like ring-hydroxylating dioxygenase large terminal subunit